MSHTVVSAGFKIDLVGALVVTKAPIAIAHDGKGNRGLVIHTINARPKEHVAGAHLNHEVVVRIQFHCLVFTPTRLTCGLR